MWPLYPVIKCVNPIVWSLYPVIKCVNPIVWSLYPVIKCAEIPVAPRHGSIEFTPRDRKRRAGTKVSFSCNPGYSLFGNKDIRCVKVNNEGAWSGEPASCRRTYWSTCSRLLPWCTATHTQATVLERSCGQASQVTDGLCLKLCNGSHSIVYLMFLEITCSFFCTLGLSQWVTKYLSFILRFPELLLWGVWIVDSLFLFFGIWTCICLCTCLCMCLFF